MTLTDDNSANHPYGEEVFVGSSPAVERLRLQIARIAPHFRVALLTGEDGVGKLSVARRLHSSSPGAGRPFHVIPSAEFTRAHSSNRGTVYLTGVESLPPPEQGRLVRALKTLDRETRVIAGTRIDLKSMVSAGKVRPDLFGALGALEMRLAPLRERLSDIPEIAPAILRRLGSAAFVSSAATYRMQNYNWPGNLQELWNVCKTLSRHPSIITEADLPPLVPIQADPSLTARLDEVMHRHVADVLQSCAGNKLRAAELLGISRSTLYRMLSAQASGASISLSHGE